MIKQFVFMASICCPADNCHRAVFFELGQTESLLKLKKQQQHRGSVASVSSLFTEQGLRIRRTFTDSFDMRFLDGSAFLNHYFIKLGWLASWKAILREPEIPKIFAALERNLNAHATREGELRLTVPMAYVEGEK